MIFLESLQAYTTALPSKQARVLILSSVLALTGVLNGCAQREQPRALLASTFEATSQEAQAMVVTANPHATRAGELILEQGGSAVDAAVAIEAVLSLVEPQSSGLAGGGFMLHWNAKTQTMTAYDGREVAPAGTTPTLFLGENGEPIPFLQAKNSGLSTGVPGAVAMLNLAHSEQGKLPWSSLFDHAKALASNGFDVSPRLANSIGLYNGRLIPKTREEGPLDAYHYFYDDQGQIRERLVNPEYAATLEAIARDPRAFYTGAIAQAIVDAVAQTPRAGTLTLEDLASYEAQRRTALCTAYRGLRACGPPPPSSWVGVGMMLGMLEHSAFPSDDRNRDWATVIEAQRLAYADRDQYVADTAFVQVPLQGMLAPEYLKQRAASIDPEQAIASVTPGDPWPFEPVKTARRDYGRDTTIDHAGTTHFVVVDHAGNVVSMTASVESIFGNSRMAGGMILNNQLTDFARDPFDDQGALVANHPAPGKQPRSSMSPTIVLDQNNEFVLATGSPGGNSILAYTLKTLVGVLDWGLTPQQAVDLPNVVARGNVVRVESDRATPEFIEDMRTRGFEIKESAGENSGLSVIQRTQAGLLLGGVDPRREGVVTAVPAPSIEQ